MADDLSTPIAIIGIGCRLPGDIYDTESLWKVLAQGTNTWSPVPSARFNEKAFYHPSPGHDGTTNHRGGHFLSQKNDVAAFDAGFFDMSAAEAQATDPQQRLLLEVSYEAFENAGIPMDRIRGSDTAVYAAIFTRDYDRNVYKDPSHTPKYQTTGCGEAILSNRISYCFGLTGPSMTLDTGCSGSLVALHQACQSLRTKECTIALTCGASLILSPDQMIGMSNMYMLNDNGRSYPFDTRGNGYGRGEGLTAVVLKRLDDALDAGDNIRAIIRNTAINQDGKTNGITLPNYKAQEALHRNVFRSIGLDPCAVQYIECHGTGTAAGDQAELQGVFQAFGRERSIENPIYVGSIKSNIGHLESSSGLAGLIKTVLMLEKGYLLPNADFQELKPDIRLQEWRLKIPRVLEPWPELRIASVNSFGYGGVNAHVILERAPVRHAVCGPDHRSDGDQRDGKGEEKPAEGFYQIRDAKAGLKVTDSAAETWSLSDCYRQYSGDSLPLRYPRGATECKVCSITTEKGRNRWLFTMTAKTRDQLLGAAGRLRLWILAQTETTLDLDSLAYTLFARRTLYPWRHTFQASSRDEVLSNLDRSIDPIKRSKALKILFIFTGQGAQWYAMGRGLGSRFPIFSDSILRSDATLRQLGASWNLVDELAREEQDSKIHLGEIAQPSTTALQIAMVDLLASFGVRPATVIGHSSGEIAAAYAAGIISHTTALRISFQRSLLLPLCKQKISAKGAMLSVALGEEDVSPFLEQIGKDIVSLACINSPSNTTVSGDEPAIDELQSRLNALGIFNRRLKVDTAYHSHHMHKVAQDYLCSLGTVNSDSTKTETLFISSVTGSQKSRGYGAEYWVENLVSTVRFSKALQAYRRLELTSLQATTKHICIELGPHGALASPIHQTINQDSQLLDFMYLPTLMRGQNALKCVLSLLGKLFEHGFPINKTAVDCSSISKSRIRLLSNLPTYPWDHSKTYWHESYLSRKYRFRCHPFHDLLGLRMQSSPDLEPSWRYIFSLDSLPWLADHVIDGLVTFPGAGYICMVIEASKQIVGGESVNARGLVLQDINFLKALVIPRAPEKIEMQLCFRSQRLDGLTWYEFRIYGTSQTDVWHEYCRGRVSASVAGLADQQSSMTKLPQGKLQTSQRLNAHDMYSHLQSNGNAYGPCFSCVQDLEMAGAQAVSHVIIPDIRAIMPAAFQQPHIIHPTVLDALLHTSLPLYGHHCGSGSVMPVAIEELSISLQMCCTPGDVLEAATEIFPGGPKSASINLAVSATDSNSERQPVLVASNLQLFGVGDTGQDSPPSLGKRSMAYHLLWEPQVTPQSRVSLENSCEIRPQNTCDPDEGPLGSPSGSRFPNYRCAEATAKNEEPQRVQVRLISAPGNEALAAALTSTLEEDNYSVLATTWATPNMDPQALCLVLDQSKQPFLENPTPEFFQHIVGVVHSTSHILWVSAQAGLVNTTSRTDPKSALVIGFARTARAERGQLKFFTLDIQDEIGDDMQAITRAISDVATKALTHDNEMEFIYHDGQVLVPRLIPDQELNDHMAAAGLPQMDDVFYSQSSRPLKLDVASLETQRSLNFSDDPSALLPPEPEQVVIEASAYALNPMHLTEHAQGIKASWPFIQGFSGFITAVGSEAQSALRVGDVVMSWNLDGPAYASHARAKACNTVCVPDRWPISMATSTAMIVPLVAGYYSLVEIAKLRKGQSVLVHGATGIYGHCIIAVAKSVGANVLATVPTIVERDNLASKFGLPNSCLFSAGDAESTNLRVEVMKLTAGKGVDVIVATPSEFSSSGLGGCIAAMGVYVQILQSGTSSQMTAPDFRGKAITCISFDLETIASNQPDLLANTLDKAISMVFAEATPSPDVRPIPLSQVQDVLAELRLSRNHEEVVLTADAETKVKAPHGTGTDPESSTKPLSDATYLIAGGLGDLGRRISKIMASNGAAHIVLLTRRSLNQGRFEKLQEHLRQIAPNLTLYAFTCDISDLTALLDVAKSLQKLMLPPVRGIIQSATVLKDRVLERMTAEEWQLPLQTKMYGTRNLSETFTSSSLDFFIMLSSLSGVVGTRGQANYAAGNTYLDAFAQRNVGLQTAYITLDLGMIEDTSTYEARSGHIKSQSLLRQGFIPIKGEQFVAVLEWALSPKTWRRGSGQFCIGIDGTSIFEAEDPTPTTRSAMFGFVRSTHEVEATVRDVSSSTRRPNITGAATATDALEIITELTSQKISSLVSVGKEDVVQDKPLQDLGLDSLTAIELKNFIRKEFNATIHASEILDEPSLNTLCDKIASRSELMQARSGEQINSVETRRVQMTSQGTPMKPHSVEAGLRPLPLPDLDGSVDLYLTSAKPLLTANDFKRTSHVAQTFRQSGRFLQDKLSSRSQASGVEGWHYDLQVPGIYLRRRTPILPFGTFYGIHHLTTPAHNQAARAAIIAGSAYIFKRKLEAGQLEQDYLNEEPLCSRSQDWLFNACREPARVADRIKKFDSNNYAIALRRGHAFKVALERGNLPIPYTELRSAFESILQMSTEQLPSSATLTADKRDSWVELRERLKSMSVSNDEGLTAIEAAAFVICLDDASPATPTERCNTLLLGDPGNRWSDKTLQFVVCANGVSGFICEHSMLDAASLRQINDHVTTAIVDSTPDEGATENVHIQSDHIQEIRFDLDDVLVQNVGLVQKNVISAYTPIELAHYKLPSMGKSFFRKYKVPSKTGIQAIIQLASLLYYGTQHPSWETLTMMLFRHGRLDWMQTVSPAMFKFCETAFDQSIDLRQRSEMLREALSTHTRTMTRISRGRGFAAHLEALWEIAQQEGLALDLFEDPTWEMMRVTSTRKVKTDASEGLRVQEAGFFMPDPESVLVHYEVEDRECRFSIQSTEGRTGRFCDALDKAAEQIGRLLELS